VSDVQLDEARWQAAEAATQLAEVERGDPTDPGWSDEYELAIRNAQATARRLEAMEAACAAQLEQTRQRAAAAEAAAPEIAHMAAVLTASRDKVATAAARHLVALSWLATLAAEHNALLADCRSRLAALGLPAGDQVTEGVLGDGIVAGNVTWTPVPCEGLVCHSLHQAFTTAGRANPFSMISSHYWLPGQVSARLDGLAPPTLRDVGATVPRAPELARMRMGDDGPLLEADRLRAMQQLADR